ncbi:MAG: hypothetical protein R3308_02335, partial [Thiohalobacterales bacterium]|nr:hypothetical protein [Thiohalobacterales bacterium]
ALFGGLFFVLLFFAALSSAIALAEPVVTWLVENYDIKRLNACIWVGIIIWTLGLLTVFSFNIGSGWTLFGKTAFELLDYLTANIMLPLGGLLIAVFAVWKMSRQSTMEELRMGDRFFYPLWRFLVRYITPIAVIIVFLNAIGIIDMQG